MAVSAGPDIIENGLVLCLDAGNRRSYPGTGTGWFDISGQNNNATMFGTVPYENDRADCFNFAGATGAFSYSASLGFLFNSNMVPTTGNFTFSCWVTNLPTLTNYGMFSNAGSGDGYRFGIGASGIYYLIGPTYTESTINFSSTSISTLWYNVVAVYARDSASVILYRNGDLQGTSAIPASQTAFPSVTPGLVRSPCCAIWTGKLANFSVYNRALNAQEISQNFNALRGRFNI